jgi:hypothetical protein
MAFAFQAPYPPEVAERVRAFYATLSEKDQRRYAAVEAARLGHGGIEYVAEVLQCSRRTIERGLLECSDSRSAGQLSGHHYNPNDVNPATFKLFSLPETPTRESGVRRARLSLGTGAATTP